MHSPILCRIVLHSSSLSTLLTYNAANFKMTNNKKWSDGYYHPPKCNWHHSMPPSSFNLLDSSHPFQWGNSTTIMCAYNDKGTFHHVESNNIIQTVQYSIKFLKLHKNWIDQDLVGVRSLCADGAMALKLQLQWHHHHEDGQMDITYLYHIHSQSNCTFSYKYIKEYEHASPISQYFHHQWHLTTLVHHHLAFRYRLLQYWV